MKLWEKLILLSLFGIIVGVVYLGSQQLVERYIGVWSFTVELPGEGLIPFLPLTLIIYSLVHALPVWLVLVLNKRGRIFKVLLSFILVAFIHLFFFLLLPMECNLRPDLNMGAGPLKELIVLLYTLDANTNTFPSMHCSFAFLTYFWVCRYRPQWQRTVLILAISIVLSTLFLKQHYVLDAVTGVLMAVGMNIFFIRKSFHFTSKS